MNAHVPAAPDHAAFAEWDAAYVLGALIPEDRVAFENHLDACERCQVAVAELAPMPGLLTRARPLIEDDDALPAPPHDLVDLVRARERKHARTLRHRVVAVVATAAAAIALVFAVPLTLQHPAPPATIALAPATSTTLTASVTLTPKDWGTSLTMDCHYGADATGTPPYGPGGGTFTLWVIDDAGQASQVSTWSAQPGDSVTLTAGTAVPLEDIAAVEVRAAGGDTLLSSRV